MKTVIVKIDRSTIRKNPKAGQTESIVDRGLLITFVYKGRKEPEWINSLDVDIESRSFQGIPGFEEIEIRGQIKVTDKLEKFIEENKKTEGLTLTIQRDYETLHHMPEPEYLYKYEKTYLKCNHCKEKVEVQDIEIDYIFDGEDEVKVETCPLCGGENSFDHYEFENLSDVKS